MAKIVQTEGRTSSLLECYAEVQPIFCKDTKKIETTIPFNSIFFIFHPKIVHQRGQLSPLGFAACQSKNCTNRANSILPQNAQMQVQGVQQSLLHQQSNRAPTLQSSHGTRRTHRTFWQIRLSHRLHGYAQIRRVWHPCHTHAATKLSFHRIHETHRNDWRRRKICVHLCNLWEVLLRQKLL